MIYDVAFVFMWVSIGILALAIAIRIVVKLIDTFRFKRALDSLTRELVKQTFEEKIKEEE